MEKPRYPSLPIPETAQEIHETTMGPRLRLISFVTPTSTEELLAYYREELPTAGWELDREQSDHSRSTDRWYVYRNGTDNPQFDLAIVLDELTTTRTFVTLNYSLGEPEDAPATVLTQLKSWLAEWPAIPGVEHRASGPSCFDCYHDTGRPAYPGLPAYPNAQDLRTELGVAQAERKTTFTTSDSPEAVYVWYDEQLSQAGWQPDKSVFEGVAAYRYLAGGPGIGLALSAWVEGNLTRVIIVETKSGPFVIEEWLDQ